MVIELADQTASLSDAICAELDQPLTPEVRESVAFFVDHLAASLLLGDPLTLTDQLAWQSRRLAVLAPGIDAEGLATATRAVVSRRMGEQVATPAAQHLEAAFVELAARAPLADAPDPLFTDLAGTYLERALAGDHEGAVEVVLRSGLAPHDVLMKVLEPAQAELGRRWENDHVSVAQEHDTTALTQRVMGLLRHNRRLAPAHGGSVYAGLVGEEQHSVGLDMVVDLLESGGWTVERADRAVDQHSIVEDVARARPDVLALSVTLYKHVVELRSVIAAVRADARTRHVPIVVGGRPFRHNPALAELVGADEWAVDGQGALAACQRSTSVSAQRHVNDVTREMVSPLETMLGLAALLQDDDSLSHRQRDLANRIIKAGSQLMTVVEDLGHGLVVVHGGPDARTSNGPVDLDELVESLLVRHQGRAAQRDIVMRQIRIPPHRGRVLVQGDVSQLERVLTTLLENAVRVTPTSGVITVRVKRDGPCAAVAIADEGPGIPVHSRDAIFDPDNATSSSGATDIGPWRGLAVCRRIAEQHGGTMTASSDHRGAVFTLELPLSERMLHHEPVPSFPPLAAVPDRSHLSVRPRLGERAENGSEGGSGDLA